MQWRFHLLDFSTNVISDQRHVACFTVPNTDNVRLLLWACGLYTAMPWMPLLFFTHVSVGQGMNGMGMARCILYDLQNLPEALFLSRGGYVHECTGVCL